MFQTMRQLRTLTLAATALGLLFLPIRSAAETSVPPPVDTARVGIDEKLGQKIPLDTLTFKDEDGKSIPLKSLFDKPVVLTLVYYRCPGTCSPLLNELSRLVQLSSYKAGEDYRMVTISFDPREDEDLASMKRTNMLKAMTQKKVPEDAWRFLTGDEKNIAAITDAVGFRYREDINGQDFVHATTLIFIGTDGMISRYLQGLRFTPADFEMAVVDATEGRARSFMKKVQRLCYTFEPENSGYVLQLNRIVLAATLLFIGGFVVFLRFLKPKHPHAPKRDSEVGDGDKDKPDKTDKTDDASPSDEEKQTERKTD